MEVLFSQYIDSISTLLGNKAGYLTYANEFGRFVQDNELTFSDETIDKFVTELEQKNGIAKVREYMVVLRKIAFKVQKEGFTSIKPYEPIFHRLIKLYANNIVEETNTLIEVNRIVEGESVKTNKPLTTNKTSQTYLNALKAYENYLYENNNQISQVSFENFIDFINKEGKSTSWIKLNVFAMKKFVRYVMDNYSKLDFAHKLLPRNELKAIEAIKI